jgi:uncharacterized protein
VRAVARANPEDLFRRIAERSARRATAVVMAVAALSIISVLLALRLDSSAAPGSLYDQHSAASKATARLDREFGGDPVLVLIRTRREGCPGGRDCRLTDLLLTPDLIRVLSLEGCVSGNLPPGANAPASVCQKLAESKPFRIVNGPGTFINESARQISARIRSLQSRREAQAKRVSEAARKIASARGLSAAEQKRLSQQARQLAQLNALEPALRYGLGPRGAGIGDPAFVHQLVFEPSISFDAPKTRFAQLFPSRTSAVVELRPSSELSAGARRKAIELVREAVADPSFRLKSAGYLVTGGPAASAGVAADVSHELAVLLVVSLLIITAAVALLARPDRRFEPVFLVLAVVALTFGAMSVLGTSLTIASIAVLPVLAGIAACHAIGFQRTGSFPLAPAASTAIAFLLLALSPVPMVRTFGAFVAFGIALSFLLTLTLGSALAGGAPRSARPPAGAGSNVPRGGWRWLLEAAMRRPGRVLAIGAAVALLGWTLSPQSAAVSGLDRLAPQDLREVKDLGTLHRESGVDRELSVAVTADDLTAPGVIPWMVSYQKKVLARHGYTEQRPCPQAQLCPAVALAGLFGSRPVRSRAQGKALLDSVPRYFTQSVISRDRRTANISFLIRRMPLEKQREVIGDLRRQLNPPSGVRADLAGTSVLAADSAGDLESSGRWLTLLALVAVFGLLVAVHRRAEAAAALLVPVAMATGWSASMILVLGTSLNPLSAVLGVLVAGLGGYVAIVLSTRYREARATDLAPVAALGRAYERGGGLRGSVAAAALGFGVLIASDVRMLRQFGAVALFDLVVVLAGVAVVLPAALIWVEQRGPLKLPRSRTEWADLGRSAYRKARVGRPSDLLARVRRLRPHRRRREAQRP